MALFEKKDKLSDEQVAEKLDNLKRQNDHIGDSLTIEQFVERTQDGRIFAVCFTKRTTGERREMVCRTNVTKGTTGAGAKYDFAEKNLLPVYDMQKQGHRTVNLDDLIWLKAGGKTYTWDQAQRRFLAQFKDA